MPPLPSEAAMPPVAAAFRTQITRDGESETSQWRYWRDAERVLREDLQSRTGDLWRRDGATLFHTLLFHDARRGIEFEQADLQMTGEETSWARHAHVVDPALLERLRVVRTGWSGAVPWRDYAGQVAGVRWQVRMRLDLMVPLRVEQQAGRQRLRTELLEAHVPSQAPWQPESAVGYDIIDFADLGDHERDPFVLRIQAQLGLGHGIGHAHRP
jgi:hypothetical protein